MSRFRQYALAVLSPIVIAAVVVAVIWSTSHRSTPLLIGGAKELFAVSPSPVVSFPAKPGETVTIEYSVKNMTDQPTRILGANTSCGCTTVMNPFPLECRRATPSRYSCK